jgi:integrase/recombinase XerD
MSYNFRREPLMSDEATRLANACQTGEEKLVIWTLLDTGLRVAELATLTSDRIDWQTHRIMVNGKGGPFGKLTKKRVVRMSARVAALLEAHFANEDAFGVSVRTMQRMIKIVANRARIVKTVTPHVLRHTFACTAIQKGISLPAVQKLLGHDRLETTAIYLNLTPEHVMQEFEAKW